MHLGLNELRQMRQLEAENAQLKRLVANDGRHSENREPELQCGLPGEIAALFPAMMGR